MIAKIVAVLFVVGVASAKPMLGVDPNTVSCDPHGQEFLLLPHFTECDKFYTCAHGQEVEFRCAPGTIFDFELQGCNWDWATSCTLRTPAGEEEDVEGSGEGSGEDIESGDFQWAGFADEVQAQPLGDLAAITGKVSAMRPVQQPTVASQFTKVLNCDEADSAARQVPFKGDCQRFWRCLNGLPHSVYCSDGLFFNEMSQQCDFEANVRCDVNQEDELKGEFIVYK